jgi:hypothetical protein
MFFTEYFFYRKSDHTDKKLFDYEAKFCLI